MLTRTLAMGAAFMWLMLGSAAHATDISVCSDALVRSTYNRSEGQFRDWRLAEKVSQDAYDKISHDGSASATIFGVPAGANYGDFQENIRRFKSSKSESLTTSQASNVMWTGLDPNSATVYSSCVDAIVNESGLVLTVKLATAVDVVLSLRWRPRSGAGYNEPSTLPVFWSGELSNLNLPKTASQGEGAPFVIPRPLRESSLAVGSGGLGSSVTITPFTPPPPPPPADFRKSFTVSASSFLRSATLGGTVQYGPAPEHDCLHNSPPLAVEKANEADFDINFDVAGSYNIVVHYIGPEGRPVKFYVNNTLVEEGLGQSMGKSPDGRLVYQVGPITFRKGTSRLYIRREGSFPSICDFQFTPS